MTGIIHNTPNLVWVSCSKCGQKVTDDLEHSCYLIKEMTDEEIIETYAEIDGRGIIEFARAILRKAQEK